MSGGSFNYMSSRLPDELGQIASQVDQMTHALEDRYELPHVTERTRLLAINIGNLVAEAEALADLWHAVEWHTSGDDGPAGVRKAALALGEPLPPCPHATTYVSYYGHAVGMKNVCNDCGELFELSQWEGSNDGVDWTPFVATSVYLHKRLKPTP